MLQDHMVVRHEAIHVIQHCVNAARGTPMKRRREVDGMTRHRTEIKNGLS